jgi:gamma-glutamyl hydrolase
MRFFSIVLLSSLFLTRGSELNEWPIVGVFTQPSSYSDEPCNGDCFYIAASYVKYIESAGARVVPIPYEAETEELDYLFESMNGFLYTGGGADMSDAAKYLYSKAVQANDEGDFFPVWGTCLGFEWLMIATSGNDSILDSVFDSENYSIPLDFTAAVSQSRLFSHAPPEVVKTLATENVTMNNHMAGIAVDHFYATPELSTFYNVLSTNTDRAGWEFVSTVEAYNYPIYGTQWHPEKVIYCPLAYYQHAQLKTPASEHI